MEIILFLLSVLILLVLCWRFNFFSFYALIFLAPFLGLTIDFSYYSFAQKIPGLASMQAPMADFLAILIFTSLILKTLFKKRGQHYLLPWAISLKQTGFEFFLPFLVVGLASLINVSPDQLGGSFKYWLRPIVFFYLMWIVLPHFFITTKEVLQKSFWALALAGIVSAFLGWGSFVVKISEGTWKRLTPLGWNNWAPLTYNHNILAEVLVMTAPLFFYFFIQNQKVNSKTKEKLLFLTFIFIVLTALLTFSRAAWIALFFQLLIYIFIKNKKNQFNYFAQKSSQFIWKKMGILTLLLLPIIIYMAVFSLSSIVKSSNITRMDMSGIAWVYFSSHPLIGNGVGTFTQLVGDTRLFTVEYGDPLDSHGVVQKMLAETGLLGLITFFIFVVWITAQLYQSAKFSTIEKELKTLILISFLGGLIFQLFNTSYYNQHLWLIAGLGLATKKVYPPDIL